MKCVDVGSVEPGMILAQAVNNHQGDLMFEAGRALTEKELRVLKSWGIEKVWVQKESTGTISQEKENILDEVVESFNSNTIENKFSDVLDDPVMVEIMRVAMKVQERRRSKLEWNDDNR